MRFARRLWDLLLEPNHHRDSVRRISRERLFAEVAFPEGMNEDDILSRLDRYRLCRIVKDAILFSIRPYNFLLLAEILLSKSVSTADLKYLVRRNIRWTHKIAYDAETVRVFNRLASKVNEMAEEERQVRRHPTMSVNRISSDMFYYHGIRETKGLPRWAYQSYFLEELVKHVTEDPLVCIQQEQANRYASAFVESARLVNYIRPHYEPGYIVLQVRSVDAEYMLSNLFGLPTDIPGFDELFGGGGILLPESLPGRNEMTPGGRVVVIKGRFGTGKSILSLQLAWEVARKGGASWVMPMEQSAEECLRALEGVIAHQEERTARIVVRSPDIGNMLSDGSGAAGAMLILGSIRESYNDFLDVLGRHSEKLRRAPLRLICIDPINSIYQTDETPNPSSRKQTLDALNEIKANGTNVLIVSEENPWHAAAPGPAFIEHMADTVIRLSVQNRHSYAQRYFEIMKSRFQREQRGEHPFSIRPARGFSIVSTPASIAARANQRPAGEHMPRINLGLSGLDNALPAGICMGDLIAVQGLVGSHKTDLGIQFALGVDAMPSEKESRWRRFMHRVPKSIIVTGPGDVSTLQERVRRFCHGLACSSSKSRKTPDDILYCVVPSGHIQPGYVFNAIEATIEACRAANEIVDRIFIREPIQWELSSPFVREETTFGDILAAFLRHLRVTSFITLLAESEASKSNIQPAILSKANLVLQCELIEYRGQRRVLVRVVKSRAMAHVRRSFDLMVSPRGLEIRWSSSLVRRRQDGSVDVVPVRLFLETKTALHGSYNKQLQHMVRSTVATDVELFEPKRITLGAALFSREISSIDQLQILELFEYELAQGRRRRAEDLPLRILSKDLQLDELFRKSTRQICQLKDGRYFAVPYSEDVGILAFRADRLGADSLRSWRMIADECKVFEQSGGTEHELIFDFDHADEDDQCALFLEIYLSFEKLTGESSNCSIVGAVDSPAGIEAALLYRILTRHRQRYTRLNAQRESDAPSRVPMVGRYWYSSVAALRLGTDEPMGKNFRITCVPGSISVSRGSFLGIPKNSAAVDVGEKVIKLLTNRQGEFSRFVQGLGLPVGMWLYSDQQSVGLDAGAREAATATDLQSDLGVFVNQSFRLCNLGCYKLIRDLLVYHLKIISNLPAADDEELRRQVQTILCAAKERMAKVSVNLSLCENCRRRPSSARITRP